jgi:hypothetical protein
MTKLGITCAELGIQHIMAGVRKPTACGKIERWTARSAISASTWCCPDVGCSDGTI